MLALDGAPRRRTSKEEFCALMSGFSASLTLT
jgi:hypothetical protein